MVVKERSLCNGQFAEEAGLHKDGMPQNACAAFVSAAKAKPSLSPSLCSAALPCLP